MVDRNYFQFICLEINIERLVKFILKKLKALTDIFDPKQQLIEVTEWRIEQLIEWANKKPWFDQGFILSVQHKIDNGMNITESEIMAIENIYDKFII